MTSTNAERPRWAGMGLLVACALVLLVRPLVAPADYHETMELAAVFTSIPFLITGCLVLLRASWHRIGWLLLGIGVAMAMALSGIPGFPVEYDVWRFENIWSIVFALFAATALLFPTGHLNRGSGWPGTIMLILFCSLPLASGFAVLSVILGLVGRESTYEWASSSPASAASDIGFLMSSVALVSGMIVLWIRFRRSTGELRRQLAWVVAALGFVAILGAIIAVVFAVQGTDDSLYGLFMMTLVAYVTVPSAITVAILRYRLYEIDRIISRTIVYALLSASLGIIYVSLVVGLQTLLRPFGEGSDLAIVATTLIVAALFLPARRRIQDVVDRRFNRRAYDAALTIDAFNARLRQEVDLDALSRDLLAVVNDTMQPARVSLWLRED